MTMATIASSLYRFISQNEFDNSSGSTLPVSIFSFEERAVNFSSETNTFVTRKLRNGAHEGLSLRAHCPPVAVTTSCLPSPEDWVDDVYLVNASDVPRSGLQEFAEAGIRLSRYKYYQSRGMHVPYEQRLAGRSWELIYFRCYELPAGTPLPDGFQCTIDDFPATGHATIYTTCEQDGELESINFEEYVRSPVLGSLPWRFVGYYLFRGAEPNTKVAADPDGFRLISTLCDHQNAISLDQLESLRMLVTAPDYTMHTLSTYLPAAAALDLLEGALRDTSEQEELCLLADFVGLVIQFRQSGFAPTVSAPYRNTTPVSTEHAKIAGTPPVSPKVSEPESPKGVEGRPSEG